MRASRSAYGECGESWEMPGLVCYSAMSGVQGSSSAYSFVHTGGSVFIYVHR